MTDPTTYTVADTLAALRRKIEADHDHDFGLVYLDNARARRLRLLLADNDHLRLP